MKIKFLKDIDLEVITDYVNDATFVEPELFCAGNEVEIDKISESEIQFGDGSISFVTPEFWEVVSILN